MKKILIITVILLITVILISKPIIEFETMHYDFGKIKEAGGPHKFNFKFTNTGDELFRVLDVKAG
ncbi:MAG: DUF1573 domain-containing protein [Candidatus Cloacimonetes bacterium]|nr:DUF1573 domain-containing protein [Candidatus Cloacimonadota bacterium]